MAEMWLSVVVCAVLVVAAVSGSVEDNDIGADLLQDLSAARIKKSPAIIAALEKTARSTGNTDLTSLLSDDIRRELDVLENKSNGEESEEKDVGAGTQKNAEENLPLGETGGDNSVRTSRNPEADIQDSVASIGSAVGRAAIGELIKEFNPLQSREADNAELQSEGETDGHETVGSPHETYYTEEAYDIVESPYEDESSRFGRQTRPYKFHWGKGFGNPTPNGGLPPPLRVFNDDSPYVKAYNPYARTYAVDQGNPIRPYMPGDFPYSRTYRVGQNGRTARPVSEVISLLPPILKNLATLTKPNEPEKSEKSETALSPQGATKIEETTNLHGHGHLHGHPNAIPVYFVPKPLKPIVHKPIVHKPIVHKHHPVPVHHPAPVVHEKSGPLFIKKYMVIGHLPSKASISPFLLPHRGDDQAVQFNEGVQPFSTAYEYPQLNAIPVSTWYPQPQVNSYYSPIYASYGLGQSGYGYRYLPYSQGTGYGNGGEFSYSFPSSAYYQGQSYYPTIQGGYGYRNYDPSVYFRQLTGRYIPAQEKKDVVTEEKEKEKVDEKPSDFGST